MNVFSGVSVLVPLVLLTAGLYGWFWYSLSGLALFTAGVPKLPREKALLSTLTMFSRDGPGKRIQDAAIPLKGTFRRHFIAFAVAYTAFWICAGDSISHSSPGAENLRRSLCGLVWAAHRAHLDRELADATHLERASRAVDLPGPHC